MDKIKKEFDNCKQMYELRTDCDFCPYVAWQHQQAKIDALEKENGECDEYWENKRELDR